MPLSDYVKRSRCNFFWFRIVQRNAKLLILSKITVVGLRSKTGTEQRIYYKLSAMVNAKIQ